MNETDLILNAQLAEGEVITQETLDELSNGKGDDEHSCNQ